jgi:hypothetical protein
LGTDGKGCRKGLPNRRFLSPFHKYSAPRAARSSRSARGSGMGEPNGTYHVTLFRSHFRLKQLNKNKMNTKYPSHRPADNVLSVLLRKLHSSEAKWLIRMVLKTYSPARVPEAPAMRRFHFLLPDILSFQNSFEAAVQLLQSPTIRRMSTRVCQSP